MSTDDSTIKLKTIPVGYVLRLREALYQSTTLANFANKLFDADTFNSFVDVLQGYFKANVSGIALRNSAAALASTTPTIADLRMLFWRLAGNVHKLKAGYPILPWVIQREPEWMPLQIVDVRLLRNVKGAVVAEYTCRVLAGSAAGMLVKRTFTRKTCAMLAKDMGFGDRYRIAKQNRTGKRKRTVHPFSSFADFVGLRFYGLFDSETCDSKPKFWHVSAPPSAKSYNRQILKQRARIDFTCPFGYTHSCSLCFVGYDSCPVATHPRTYSLGQCSVCKESDWFDSGISRDCCVSCFNKQRLKGH
jgi:hypothetical protein